MHQSCLVYLHKHIGIDEMRKRGLMGDRMLTVILVLRSLVILGLLTNAAVTARRQAAASL